MNYKLLINDYLEDRITSEEEHALFGELLTNKNLRDDFKYFIDVDHLEDNENKVQNVPDNITKSIFGALNVPINDNEKDISKFSGFFSKYRQAIVATCATSFVLILSYLLFLRPVPEITLGISDLQSSKEGLNIVLNEAPYGNAFSSSKGMYSEYGNSGNNNSSQIAMNTLKDEEINSTTPLYNNEKPQYFSALLFDPPIPYHSHQHYRMRPTDNLFAGRDDQAIENFYDRVYIELSGMNNIKLEDQMVEQSRRQLFNNTALSVQYAVNDRLHAGLQARIENYYLDYSGKIEDTDYNLYQNTNYFSLGVSAKYYLTDGQLRPYGELYAGGNKIGAIARAGAGLEYRYSPDYAFVVGCEWSSLMYKQNSNYYLSDKFAIKYGIKLRL